MYLHFIFLQDSSSVDAAERITAHHRSKFELNSYNHVSCKNWRTALEISLCSSLHYRKTCPIH